MGIIKLGHRMHLRYFRSFLCHQTCHNRLQSAAPLEGRKEDEEGKKETMDERQDENVATRTWKRVVTRRTPQRRTRKKKNAAASIAGDEDAATSEQVQTAAAATAGIRDVARSRHACCNRT